MRALLGADQILRRTVELLARAERVAHVGHWTSDLRTGLSSWSDEARRIYGVSANVRASYEAFLALIHPQDRARFEAWTADALAGRPIAPIELRVVRPDGTVRFIEGDCDVQFAAGRPVTMFGTVLDITERRRVTSELADSETKFRTLFDTAQAAIFVMDAEKFVECNRRTEELFGRPRSEIVGLSPLDVSPPLQPDGQSSAVSAVAHMRAALAGEPQFFYWVHLRQDGTPFDAEVSLNRIDIRGQAFLQAIVRDVTDRRRDERLLRLQGAALDAAGNAIVITDRNGAIEWVNAAFSRLTGFEPKEAVGRTPGSLIGSGHHPPAFFKTLWETITSGNTWRGEIVNRAKDGHLYTEEMSVTPIRDAAGQISHFVAIKEDISQRLKLEAQFRQAQKMESVGHLASGIAHDFNNLLTVINGLTELMLEQAGRDDSLRADIEEIHAAGERAATLTRQLLAFSRQQILAPRFVNLSGIVAGVEKLLRRLLGEDVEMSIEAPPDLGTVKVDPGQVEQIVTNLAVNARDAMPTGGHLTITLANVDVETPPAAPSAHPLPAGRYVSMAVRDTGTGMDEETQARIFEPFFTTKGVGRGTGLGLSTVYGIVKQSHGFIWVSSEVGRGSTFTILFPRVEGVDATQDAPPSSRHAGKETVLVVEDNGSLRLLTSRFLTKAGYAVLTAATGAEALQLLKQRTAPVHLLLTDVVMPGMGGRQLADEVAGVYPEIRILYMSGYTSDTVVRHGVMESTVSFISKPFTAAALLRKVRETLDAR